MDQVSAEQVKEAVRSHGVTRWRLRRCSICDAGLFYYFENDGALFDSNCDCGSGQSAPQPVGYDCVAKTLNMQTPQIRARMWSEMLGLVAPSRSVNET